MEKLWYQECNTGRRFIIKLDPGTHVTAALLDFADWRLRGKPAGRRFDVNPFPELPAAFSWSAPTREP